MSKDQIKIILKKIATIKIKINKISTKKETDLYKKKLLKASSYMNRVVRFLEKKNKENLCQ